jgi:hypothetical protein
LHSIHDILLRDGAFFTPVTRVVCAEKGSLAAGNRAVHVTEPKDSRVGDVAIYTEGALAQSGGPNLHSIGDGPALEPPHLSLGIGSGSVLIVFLPVVVGMVLAGVAQEGVGPLAATALAGSFVLMEELSHSLMDLSLSRVKATIFRCQFQSLLFQGWVTAGSSPSDILPKGLLPVLLTGWVAAGSFRSPRRVSFSSLGLCLIVQGFLHE